jgi:hypothetical protein
MERKAVVIWIDYANEEKGETKVFGPFDTGTEAAAFGFRRLKGEEWFWEEMLPTD